MQKIFSEIPPIFRENSASVEKLHQTERRPRNEKGDIKEVILDYYRKKIDELYKQFEEL